MSSMTVRPPLTIMALVAFTAGVAIANMFKWRHAKAKELFLKQCDVALANPRLANPTDIDMEALTLGGSREIFGHYEWYLVRLLLTLDECLALAPDGPWEGIAKSRIGTHRAYLSSDYFTKKDCCVHFSPRLQALICQQRN